MWEMIKFLVRIHEGREHLADLGLNRMIILKLTLRNRVGGCGLGSFGLG
jgi:hypothetical protein